MSATLHQPQIDYLTKVLAPTPSPTGFPVNGRSGRRHQSETIVWPRYPAVSLWSHLKRTMSYHYNDLRYKGDFLNVIERGPSKML